MRNYLQIHLNDRSIEREAWDGEQLVKAGRCLIAKTLVETGVATVDPLSADNPLIFSCGPFAGTTWSNANRLSVGCKSPLTGGIKEANAGGTFAYALACQGMCGLTLHGQSEEWVVIHFAKDGTITFYDATPYLGRKNYEVAESLKEKYGSKIAIGMIGVVGEYQGLLAGISFTDNDGRPSRLAARGGVGAVMGSKRVKAMVVELDKMPQLHDRKKTLDAVRVYAKQIQESEAIQSTYTQIGTMSMGDYTQVVGGMPNLNFTSGAAELNEQGEFTMGGTYIRDVNVARGGEHVHACMPGCVIQCSNVFVDKQGQEITSPVEYETISLLGTNCGLYSIDDLAEMNQWCNELGIDTIETGATIAVMMDAGKAPFGDLEFMRSVFHDLMAGTPQGKFYAQGTARVGEQLNFHRLPVIKKQAISAYDPRVIEVTGITMMVTAQGADHTAGNVPKLKTIDKELPELIVQSLESQIATAAADSIGLCMFGRLVTNPNIEFVANSINDALGTSIKPTFFHEIGRETLRLEREFNLAAGFTAADDELPAFFYDEPLPPSNKTARFHGEEVHHMYDLLDQVGTQSIPDEYGRVHPA